MLKAKGPGEAWPLLPAAVHNRVTERLCHKLKIDEREADTLQLEAVAIMHDLKSYGLRDHRELGDHLLAVTMREVRSISERLKVTYWKQMDWIADQAEQEFDMDLGLETRDEDPFRILRDDVLRLGAKCQLILILHYFVHWSHRTISDNLGWLHAVDNEDSSKSQLSHCLSRLRTDTRVQLRRFKRL